MTDLPAIIGNTATTAHVVEALARQAVEPRQLSPGIWAGVSPQGAIIVTDLNSQVESHRPNPTRKQGTQTVHDAAAFIAYVAKHGQPETEVWADNHRQRLTAVINAHGDTDAGWADHRVTLGLDKTPAWTVWSAYDGKMLDQLSFAEHVENRLIDFIEPTGADMLELAQSFIANRTVKFESSKRLQSSETQLEYREEIDAKAGRKGQIAIPDRFTLALQPFEGSSPYKITARLRYRIVEGQLRLGYNLDRPEDVIREAFGDIVTAVTAAVTAPVWAGSTS